MDVQIETLIHELESLTEREYYAESVRLAMRQKLLSAGEAIVESLIAIMKAGAQNSPYSSHGTLTLQARIAIQVLGDLGDSRAFEAILELMKNPVFIDERHSFGEAFLRCGHAQTRDHLVDILIDILQNCYCPDEVVPGNMTDEEVNVFTMGGLLVQLGDPRGLQAIREKQVQDGNLYSIQPQFLGGESAYNRFLIDSLDSKKPQWRAGAARLLGRLNVQEAVPTLILQLRTDPASNARWTAASGLGALENPTALVHLMIVSLFDADFEVRVSSRMAFEKILHVVMSNTLTPQAAQMLSSAIEDFGQQALCELLLEALQTPTKAAGQEANTNTNSSQRVRWCERYLNLCIPLMSHEVRRDVLYPGLLDLTHHPETQVAEIARRLIDPSAQSAF